MWWWRFWLRYVNTIPLLIVGGLISVNFMILVRNKVDYIPCDCPDMYYLKKMTRLSIKKKQDLKEIHVSRKNF